MTSQETLKATMAREKDRTYAIISYIAGSTCLMTIAVSVLVIPYAEGPGSLKQWMWILSGVTVGLTGMISLGYGYVLWIRVTQRGGEVGQ